MTAAILAIFCASAFILSQWASYWSGTVTENSVLRDETDRQLTEVSADAIYKQFDLFEDEAKWDGAIFRYSTIINVSFNKTIEASLPPENPWLENTLSRTVQIENFRNEVFKPYTTSGDSGTKRHSSVYLPIARELHRLSESKSQIRRLFVYSDLMENRPDLSFYNDDQFKMLIDHPEHVLKKFEEWFALPSLEGIEVHLIYQPADIKADGYFRTVSEFYGRMLEAKGAKVLIEANLMK